MARGGVCVALTYVCAILIAVATVQVHADEYTHSYQEGDTVNIYVNKIGPYHNPSETYPFYHYGFCRVREESDFREKWSGFGEIFQGNHLINSDYTAKFAIDTPKTWLCNEENIGPGSSYWIVIRDEYYYEMIIDDLPVWGMFGKKNPRDPADRVQPVHGMEKEGVYTNELSLLFIQHTLHDLYTHQQYVIEYNNDRITGVTLNTLDPIKIGYNQTGAGSFNMYYSVKWIENRQASYEARYEKYLDKDFFEHKIHWFAIFNSFMMVVFLTGLVAMILMRTLRKDYQRYNVEDEDLELMERDVNEETGWKLVHGDVFRPVEWLETLSVLIGTGAQLTSLAALMIIFAIAGELWSSRGAMVTCLIFSWAFTSFVSGYVSGGFYARNDGKDWIWCMLLTSILFPAFIFVIAFFINLIAMYLGSAAQIPIGTTFIVILIWGLISFPLTIAGTVIGRNWAGTADLPCRVKRIPSPIPEIPIYFHPIVVSLFSGLLPFGSIFIELYFVMTSFWSYKVYYVYGFMLLSFIILMMVTACICIVGTYFLLNSENYHWQWTSFNGGFSIAFYIYGYCIYYFNHKTNMMGLFQTCYFFGYSAMLAVGVGLVCGFVGYMASSVFVKRIYRNVKCD